MRNALLGTYTYAEFGACLAAWYPIMAVSYLRHRNDPVPRVPGRWIRRLGKTAAQLTPVWKFDVRGEPPADIHTRGYVVVSNHESVADPFLVSFLPWDMRWIGKEELFRAPIIGPLLRMGGDIAIRRGDRDSVKVMVAECVRTLRAGLSIMMFPEGTRSKNAELLPFKDGAFQVAIEAQAPILPLALSGTHSCRPKGSKWFGEARGIVTVLEPISTVGMTQADAPRLRDEVRARVARAVEELRLELGSRPSQEG